MPRIQNKRGPHTEAETKTLMDGELYVDKTHKSLCIHDGSTRGGTETARADVANVHNPLFPSHGGLGLPVGTDAQRLINQRPGIARWNSDRNVPEMTIDAANGVDDILLGDHILNTTQIANGNANYIVRIGGILLAGGRVLTAGGSSVSTTGTNFLVSLPQPFTTNMLSVSVMAFHSGNTLTRALTCQVFFMTNDRFNFKMFSNTAGRVIGLGYTWQAVGY